MSKRPDTDIGDLVAAIQEFETKLPGWWWKVGTCNLTNDADCGPDFRDERCSEDDVEDFDKGFSVDLVEGSLADALRWVMREALNAIAARDSALQKHEDRL